MDGREISFLQVVKNKIKRSLLEVFGFGKIKYVRWNFGRARVSVRSFRFRRLISSLLLSEYHRTRILVLLPNGPAVDPKR